MRLSIIKTFPVVLWMTFLSVGSQASAQTAACSEDEKIAHLIQKVDTLDGTFVRNGKEHTPKDAAEHLRYKLKQGKGSIFAPSKEKWTAQMFIDKIASKSSASGKAYTIRPKNAPEVKAKDWMLQQLADCKPAAPKP